VRGTPAGFAVTLSRDGAAAPSSFVAASLSQDVPGAADFLVTVDAFVLQGFAGPRARERIVERFAELPLLVPDRQDHVEAAELRNLCRRRGVQVGTIDALLAQLCIRHALAMLTTDRDFGRMARFRAFEVWKL